MYDDRTKHSRHIIEEVESPLRDPRPPAAGAQVDPLRRGAGPGQVDPPARPELAGRPGLPPAGPDAARHGRRRRHRRHDRAGERPRPPGQAGAVLDAGRAEAGASDTTGDAGASGAAVAVPDRRSAPVPHARPAGKHALFSTATPAGEHETSRPLRPPTTDPVPPTGPLSRGLLVVRFGDPGRSVRFLVLLQLPVRGLAPAAAVRPVDDLSGLSAPDLDQRDPVPVIRIARSDGASDRTARPRVRRRMARRTARPARLVFRRHHRSGRRVGLAAPLPGSDRLRRGRLLGLRRGRPDGGLLHPRGDGGGHRRRAGRTPSGQPRA